NGRAAVTGAPGDLFAFRTPPLRNVALTAPYFHNGSFTTLESAVRHYINTPRSLQEYDKNQLPLAFRPTVHEGASVWNQLLANQDPLVVDTLRLTNGEVADLVVFLQALTDPSVANLPTIIPPMVPSGLPVAD